MLTYLQLYNIFTIIQDNYQKKAQTLNAYILSYTTS